MSKDVISDLSNETPSDRVPPGRYYFEGHVRVPLLGRVLLTTKSPDRAPGAVATSWLALSVAGLAIVAIFALLAQQYRLPSWTLLIAASAFAATMIGETRLALWYQHGRLRYQDLTATEGTPTIRGDTLIDPQQTHHIEVARGQATVTAVKCVSSAWSLLGLSMAFVILAAAALIPAAAFIGLATLIPGPAAETVISAVLAFITTAACGTVMMIRVEQHERGTTEAAATGGNKNISTASGPSPPPPAEHDG